MSDTEPRDPQSLCQEMGHIPWHELDTPPVAGTRPARWRTCFCGEQVFETVLQSPQQLEHVGADAIEWAREFMARYRSDNTLATDEAQLVGWFAACLAAGKAST